MPDLIIKPTNTSGNKVIIQDQAGGAVLTTADSGATLGNSTQDNITRLGTVTVGTLSSGVTFPANHILQVQSDSGQVYYTNSTTSLSNGIVADPAVSITPASASNKILVMGMCQFRPEDNYLYADFRRVISGGATTDKISGSTAGLIQISGGERHNVHYHYLDSPNTTSAVQYQMQFANDNNSATVAAGHSSVGSTITAFEIQG